VDRLDSAINAEKGGAARIELCSCLSEGGVTPSIGLLMTIKKHVHIPVFVMIRPRSGDFLYSEEEVEIMRNDIIQLKKARADGFVFGILKRDGSVDKERCMGLIDLTKPMPSTFHRAIDVAEDVLTALNDIIDIGFDRVLTSGGHKSAAEGLEVLKHMVDISNNRVVIMPGGGIAPGNLESVLSCGAKEFHASARHTIPSAMSFQNSKVSMGSQQGQEYEVKVTSSELVKELVNIAKDVLP